MTQNKKYGRQSIAITCKAYELLLKLAELNKAKKYVLVSELIEDLYNKQIQDKKAN